VDNFYLSALVREVEPEILGRTVVRASLTDSILLIDLRLPSDRQLLASLDRATPALYLSTKAAAQSFAGKHSLTFFLSLLRKHLVGSKVVKVWKEPLDRIVRIDFERLDAGDNKVHTSLLLTFTGRSANAYLADAQKEVIGTLFEYESPGQSTDNASFGTLDRASLTTGMNDSTSQFEVLERPLVAAQSLSSVEK